MLGPTVLECVRKEHRILRNASDCLEDAEAECLRVVVADFANVRLGDSEVSVQEAPEETTQHGDPEIGSQTEDVDRNNDADHAEDDRNASSEAICKPSPEEITGDSSKRVGSQNPSRIESNFRVRNLTNIEHKLRYLREVHLAHVRDDRIHQRVTEVLQE